MALKPTTTAQDAYVEMFERHHSQAHNELIDKLNEVALKLYSISMDKHYLRDAILVEVSKALMETKKYFRALESNTPRNYETEGKLVMLWSLAAAPLSMLDKELGILCELEDENWLHPDGWTNEEIIEFGVKLDLISRTFMRLSFPVSVWH
ncbi:hypothetical protein L1077_25670 [Pseudoalteromonas luteoviolacea]|uniref:hypothetical protein n=1 Tax=Pseudoalteromonas luteoviolacea TaxID=43657 RepID=UPI001F258760|nr:hypothetical protein [Pseudoalteromonas luteoviolacea]MCF6442816.1 hypothetical protein [Pseudoalteromonas luteoviolacea]